MERVTLITILLVFLAGMAFCQWGIPLLDGLLNLILQWIEVNRGHLAISIAKDTATISNIKKETEQDNSTVRSIGFSIPVEEEEEYNEDDD